MKYQRLSGTHKTSVVYNSIRRVAVVDQAAKLIHLEQGTCEMLVSASMHYGDTTVSDPSSERRVSRMVLAEDIPLPAEDAGFENFGLSGVLAHVKAQSIPDDNNAYLPVRVPESDEDSSIVWRDIMFIAVVAEGKSVAIWDQWMGRWVAAPALPLRIMPGAVNINPTGRAMQMANLQGIEIRR